MASLRLQAWSRPLGALCSLVLLVASCAKSGDSGATQPVSTTSSVAVSQDATLVPLATVQLTATPKDASGAALTGKTVSWSSSNTSVATVSGSGLVTALTPGTAIITATSEGKSGTVTMTVREGAQVGPAGATFSALQGAVKVTLPAGALATSTAITVATSTDALTDARVVPGSVFEIGPSGTQFGQAGTLSLAYDPAKVRSIDQQSDLRLVTKNAQGNWVPLNAAGSGSVDAVAHVVTGPLTHLSPFALLSINAVAGLQGAVVGTQAGAASFQGTIVKANSVQLFLAATNAFGLPAAPQGTPQATSSDATKITATAVAKASGGSQGVVFTLTAIDIGTATVTVSVDGQSTTITVSVVPAPSLTITGNAGGLITPQGTAATASEQVQIARNNFTGTVTLSAASAAPAFITASFSQSTLVFPASTANVSFTASGFLAPGSYPVTITATAIVAGLTQPLQATTTFTVTVTVTNGSIVLASANAAQPAIAAYFKIGVAGTWATIACAVNSCPVTFSQAATALSVVVVIQKPNSVYYTYMFNVTGAQMPFLPQFVARETVPRGTVQWMTTGLAAGATLIANVGDARSATSASAATLSFSNAAGGPDLLSAVVTAPSGGQLFFLPGIVSIPPSGIVPVPLDLTQPGITPEMHAFTVIDASGAAGPLTFAHVLTDGTGGNNSILTSGGIFGAITPVSTIPQSALPPGYTQGWTAFRNNANGSGFAVQINFVAGADRTVTINTPPPAPILTQNNFGCEAKIVQYPRNNLYRVGGQVSEWDRAGGRWLWGYTTDDYNGGAGTTIIINPDFPNACLYLPPPFAIVETQVRLYGSPDGALGPSSYFTGYGAGFSYSVATSPKVIQ